jgi:putative flippase GtrA
MENLYVQPGPMTEKKKRNSFFRFQFTAIVATMVDFLMTIFFKEVCNVHYSYAVALGATCGAVTAFTINRYWVFRAVKTHAIRQAIRYILVVIGSVVLNTSGTYLVTEKFHLQYLVSKIIVGLVVGFTYSYQLSRRFVFYV